MWGADGMMYFASERDDIFNIWRIAPTGGAPAQVTRHKEDGVQFPSISPDGKTIVYENEFELWTLDVPSGSPKKVTIDMAFDPKDNLITWVQRTQQGGWLRAVARRRLPRCRPPRRDLHRPDRRRGRREDAGHELVVARSGREFSPDGRYVAYLSDESKEQEVWVFDRTASTRGRSSARTPSFKEPATGRPTRRSIAYAAANRLFVVDVETGASDRASLTTRPAAISCRASRPTASGSSTRGGTTTRTRRCICSRSRRRRSTTSRRTRSPTRAARSRRTGRRSSSCRTATAASRTSSSCRSSGRRRIPNDPLVRERLKKAAARGAPPDADRARG